jgi:hypothetical protein
MPAGGRLPRAVRGAALVRGLMVRPRPVGHRAWAAPGSAEGRQRAGSRRSWAGDRPSVRATASCEGLDEASFDDGAGDVVNKQGRRREPGRDFHVMAAEAVNLC